MTSSASQYESHLSTRPGNFGPDVSFVNSHLENKPVQRGTLARTEVHSTTLTVLFRNGSFRLMHIKLCFKK